LNHLEQGCATRVRGPKGALELTFCGPRKGPDFTRVLPIFRG